MNNNYVNQMLLGVVYVQLSTSLTKMKKIQIFAVDYHLMRGNL